VKRKDNLSHEKFEMHRRAFVWGREWHPNHSSYLKANFSCVAFSWFLLSGTFCEWVAMKVPQQQIKKRGSEGLLSKKYYVWSDFLRRDSMAFILSWVSFYNNRKYYLVILWFRVLICAKEAGNNQPSIKL